MKKVTIYGPIFGTSGYCIHCRSLANALADVGVDVKLEVPLFPGWETHCSDKELLMIQKKNDRDRVGIVINLPHTWPLFWHYHKRFFGFCVWEGDKVPKGFLPFLLNEKVDKILVPSEHTRDAIISRDNKLIDKIEIIHHGVDHSLFYPENKKQDDKFTLICNSGWAKGKNDRKGVQFLLKAYVEEFTNKDNVKLLLKINPAYNTPNWNFAKELEKIGIKKTETTPEIVLNYEALDYRVMRNLYNMGDVYICTQMADAFNIPGLEAMACGKPTIQCKFGGQMSYLNENNGWIIEEGEFVEAEGDILYEGVKWFKPDIECIRRIMRYVYNNQQEVKVRGKHALIDSKNWSWRKSAEKLKELL